VAQSDPPFARVHEARRSVREYGERPLTVRQIGEFLYRVGRVADYWEDELHAPRGSVRLAGARQHVNRRRTHHQDTKQSSGESSCGHECHIFAVRELISVPFRSGQPWCLAVEAFLFAIGAP